MTDAMRVRFVGIVAMFVLCGSVEGAAAPATMTTTSTTSPSTAPVPSASAGRAARADARNPAILAAIPELVKEIESALRKGEDPPRIQSDYFFGQTDVPPGAVILALRRPIGGGDPRVQSYVKWQLLSALPATLDEKTAAELLQVYRAAPPPIPRLGIEKQQRDELERMIRNARENEVERLTEQFEQMEQRVARDNGFILKYRDALFAKLPPGYDAIAAGFEDVVARVNVGADAEDHVEAVCKAVEAWAATGPPPEQMKAVARALAQLEKTKGKEYYSRLYWGSSEKMTWTKSQASVPKSQLDDVQEFLAERIKNASVPLKLKEER